MKNYWNSNIGTSLFCSWTAHDDSATKMQTDDADTETNTMEKSQAKVQVLQESYN